MLFRRGKGTGGRLCLGHALMENRNGLVMDARLTEAMARQVQSQDPGLAGIQHHGCRLLCGSSGTPDIFNSDRAQGLPVTLSPALSRRQASKSEWTARGVEWTICL